MNSLSELLPNAFIRLPQVVLLSGLSRSSIYDCISKQRFPAQHKLTTHAAGWRVRDIRAWLADPSAWHVDDVNENSGREG